MAFCLAGRILAATPQCVRHPCLCLRSVPTGAFTRRSVRVVLVSLLKGPFNIRRTDSPLFTSGTISSVLYPPTRKTAVTMAPSPSTPQRAIDPDHSDFDAASLRVADLRSLLSRHDIRLPSSARKADLVKAVEEHLSPVKRSPLPSSSLAAISASDVQKATTGSKSRSRKLAASSREKDVVDDVDEKANFSDHNPFQAGSGSETSPSSGLHAKQTKKMSSTRPKKPSDQKETTTARRKTMDPSSSPRTPTASVVPRKRATSASGTPSSRFVSYIDPGIAKSPPRTIDQSFESAVGKGHPKTRNIPGKGRLQQKGFASDSEDGDEADVSRAYDGSEDDEDLTMSPGEEVALRRGKPRTKRSNQEHPPTLTSGLSAVARGLFSTVLLAWWAWYIRESKVIGYCDVGSDSNKVLNERQIADAVWSQSTLVSDIEDPPKLHQLVPTFAQPHCATCPPHAVCSDGLITSCSSTDYILKPAFLSQLPLLGSLVPLSWKAAKCQADSRKLEMIDELAGEIARQLGQWRGAVVCGSKTDPQIAALSAKDLSLTDAERSELRYGLQDSSLYELLSSMRDEVAVPSLDYFEYLWTHALEELQIEKVVLVKEISDKPRSLINVAGQTQDTDEDLWQYLRVLVPSANIAVVPFACRMKLWLTGLVRAVSVYVVAGIGPMSVLLLLRSRLRRSRIEGRKADEVADEVFRRLAEQQLHSFDSTLEPSHLPVSHLRDLLLPASAFSTASRKRIWSAVAKCVESNANVRTATKRWKGEWTRAWEWVGVNATGGVSSVAGTPRTSRPGTPRTQSRPQASELHEPLMDEAEPTENPEADSTEQQMEMRANSQRKVSVGMMERS